MLLRGPAVATLAALAGLCALYEVRTYDTFFHLAAGRYIVEHGAVPEVDPFSFTFRGAPWHNHSPLAQVIFHAVEQRLGFEGLCAMNAALAAALVALPLLALRVLGHDPRMAVVLLLLGPVAFRETLVARPHLLGYVALLLCCIALTRHARTGCWRALAPVPPIYALWVGMHGSHLIALVLLGTLCLVRLWGGRRTEALQTGTTALLCLGLLAWLSPGAFAQGAGHVGDRALETIVPEWEPLQPAHLLSPAGLAFLLIWLSTLLGAALAWTGGARGPAARAVRDPAWLSMLAVPMGVALTSVRMLPLFMMAASPLWFPAASLAIARLSARPWKAVSRGLRPALALLPAAALVVGLLVLTPDGARFGWGLDRSRVPVAAVDYLQGHPHIERLYNAYNYGGYLMYRGVPVAGVFIDGRAITVYPSAFMQAFDAAYDDPRKFEALARHFRVDAVLMPRRSARTPGLIAHLTAHPGWAEAYRDAQSVLFEVAR